MRKGRLFVISGPSGTGKGTICEGLLQLINAELSISMTTRDPRHHEVDGVSYFFVSKDKFRETIAEDGFYEYAEIFGQYYGTPKEPVERKLEEGIDVILEIDTQGAMQVKNTYPDAIFVFILPPSMTELRIRLEGRGTETQDRVEERLLKAKEEIAYLPEYDYYIINDDIEEAILAAVEIVRSQHRKVGKDVDRIVRKYLEE